MAQDGGLRVSLAVVTPESVAFSYEVAGMGTRFLALLIDHLLQICFLSTLIIASAALRLLSQWTMVLYTAGGTLFVLLYFIIFEILWRGQTPGKRLMHLRVIRNGGYGLTAAESILRNLIRLIDFLPLAYGAGMLTMLISNDSRRLGDYVAGTVVIKDLHVNKPFIARIADGGALDALGEELRLLVETGVRRFSEAELHTMREFIRRRSKLTADARNGLAERLASTIKARLPEAVFSLTNPIREELIEAVVAAYEKNLVRE